MWLDFFSNVMSQIVTKLLRINLDMLTVVYVYMYMYMFQPRLSYKLLYPRFALGFTPEGLTVETLALGIQLIKPG